MKNILFYGDSNTWGYMPVTGERYPFETRWTTVAQKALGEEYHCVAAGLSGRTTVFRDPWKSCRSGMDAIDFELLTHMPLDLVVIMLGTNDLKFGTPHMIARGMEALTLHIKGANERHNTAIPVFPEGAKILIVSPILVGADINATGEEDLMPNGHEDSKKLAPLFKTVAENCGAYFMDAAEFAEPSALDCVHLTAEGHHALGLAIAEKIKELFAE